MAEAAPSSWATPRLLIIGASGFELRTDGARETGGSEEGRDSLLLLGVAEEMTGLEGVRAEGAEATERLDGDMRVDVGLNRGACISLIIHPWGLEDVIVGRDVGSEPKLDLKPKTSRYQLKTLVAWNGWIPLLSSGTTRKTV